MDDATSLEISSLRAQLSALVQENENRRNAFEDRQAKVEDPSMAWIPTYRTPKEFYENCLDLVQRIHFIELAAGIDSSNTEQDILTIQRLLAGNRK